MKGRDSIVVGGGVVGLSVAWELIGRGQRVTVLERDRVGKGTSWAAAGILPPAPLGNATDPIDRLRGLSHELFPTWVARLRRLTGIDVGYRRCGAWYLATTAGERAAMAGMEGYWGELNIQCQRVTHEELTRREPALTHWAASRPASAAWWIADECQIRSPDFLRALAEACRIEGADIRERTRVLDVRSVADGIEILTDDGPVRGHQAIVCGGAWTGQVAERLRLQTALVPVRGQILMLKTTRPVLGSIVNLGHRYLVCRDDGRTLVGSSEEEVGFRSGTTSSVLNGLRDFAATVVPELGDAPVERSWSGLRPMTFDGFPMIGRVPGHGRLFVAAGHFRSGVHLSCGTAILVADLMTNETPAIDIEPFRVGKQQSRQPV